MATLYNRGKCLNPQQVTGTNAKGAVGGLQQLKEKRTKLISNLEIGNKSKQRKREQVINFIFKIFEK